MASAVERLVQAILAGGSVVDLIPLDQLTSLPDNAFFTLFERLLGALLDTDRVGELLDHMTLDIERGLNENYPIDVISRYLAHVGSSMTIEQQDLVRRLYSEHHAEYLTTMLQLANWVGDGRGLTALQVLQTIRGTDTILAPDEAKLVIDTARSYNNYEFISSFSEWFIDLLPTATTPPYVRDLGLRNLNLEEHRASVLAGLNPEIMDVAGELMGTLEVGGDPVQLGQLARLQDDPLLAKVLGPVNYNDQAPNEFCQRYGGCRYMTCRCHESEVYDDQGLPDWFLGYCVECGDVIPSRQAATRQTLPHGGYHGCYCSVRCLAIHLYNLEHQDSYHHDELQSSNIDEYDRDTLLKQLPTSVPDQVPDRELYYLTRLPLLDQLLTSTTLQQLYQYELQEGRLDGQRVQPVQTTDEVYYRRPGYYERLFNM